MSESLAEENDRLRRELATVRAAAKSLESSFSTRDEFERRVLQSTYGVDRATLLRELGAVREEARAWNAAATAAEGERDSLAAAMRWLHHDSGTCCTVGCYMPATHHSAAYNRHYCWRCADDGDDVILDALPHLAALKAALDVPRVRP